MTDECVPRIAEEAVEPAYRDFCAFIPYPELVLPDGVDGAVKRALASAAAAGVREGLRMAAEIAEEQEGHWRREKRLRGNYRVRSAISECERVAAALRSAAEGVPGE